MTTFKCIIQEWECHVAPDSPEWEQVNDVEASDDEKAAQLVAEKEWDSDPCDPRGRVVHVRDEEGTVTICEVEPDFSVSWIARRRKS
jgi:hypothetical protein